MQFQVQYLFQQVLHFPLPGLPGAAQLLLLALCQLTESWGLVLLVLLFQLLTQFLALLPAKQETQISDPCQRLAKARYLLSMIYMTRNNRKTIIRPVDFFRRMRTATRLCSLKLYQQVYVLGWWWAGRHRGCFEVLMKGAPCCIQRWCSRSWANQYGCDPSLQTVKHGHIVC